MKFLGGSKHRLRAQPAIKLAGLASTSLISSLFMLNAAEAAVPAPDPASIITLQIENDAFSIPSTDRYYTSGESLGYVLPTGVLPNFIADLGHGLFGDGSQRLAFNLQQVIYTPAETQLYNPNPYDRPYAGQITLHTTLIQDTDFTRSLAQVSIGVVGPAGLGQSIQNGFHSIIGDKSTKGWGYQLHNEPTLDFFGGRIWRYDVGSPGNGIGFQLLPQVTGQVGNSEIYAQGGVIARFGSGLDADFGPAVIQPAMSGTDAYTPTQPFVWYVFGGALGRIVAHSLLVQGNNFQSSRGVPLTPVQADLEVGAAIIVDGLRVSATEVFETPEFHNQAAPEFFQYGSIAISARF
jgi:lipid A 3-O-deacylase